MYEESELTGKIIGLAMKVHGTLGNGFPEAIYQRALEIELIKNEVRYERELAIPVYYDDQQIGLRRVDFLVESRIPVELKAIIKLEDVHLAQAKNYLEAFNKRIGLLINFGSKSLEFKRLINSRAPSPSIDPSA